MGQTLTHGVYLPSEGERNCYSGLASNWRLLDGAIGTVAAHTTAIAGKADISHSHGNITNDGKVGTTANLPLITGTGGAVQAGSFGNQANTFCEGNDSRLSDARTPVAHTHTKSDVTDLFNSANTWTGDNTFSKTVAIEKSTDTGNFLALKNTVAELGSTPASATPVTIAYRDKNNDNLGYMGVYYDTDGSNHFRLYVRNKFTSGAPSTSGSPDYAFFGLRLNADKSKEGILKASLRPYDNNTYDLGSSSYKWKTLNGVNPGALSLPDYNNYLDVTSNIPVASLDGTQIDLNIYLADKTGWLSIVIADIAGNYITVTQGRAGGSTVFNNSRTFHTGAQSNGYISVFFPIIASMSKFAFIKASSLIQMRFYYSLGNV